MKKLHPKQKALLELLKKNVDDPMTIRELQNDLKISSSSVVQHHIQQLEKKGYLKRNPSNPKDYQVLSDPEKPIVYLNLYGLAQCGPKGSILDGDPVDRIPIASKLIKFPAEEAFLLEAKGDSMTPKINPGDLVIVQKSKTAEDGDLVVCINNLEVLIKRYNRHGRQIILHSENPNFPPFIAEKNFRMKVLSKVYCNTANKLIISFISV